MERCAVFIPVGYGPLLLSINPELSDDVQKEEQFESQNELRVKHVEALKTQTPKSSSYEDDYLPMTHRL